MSDRLGFRLPSGAFVRPRPNPELSAGGAVQTRERRADGAQWGSLEALTPRNCVLMQWPCSLVGWVQWCSVRWENWAGDRGVRAGTLPRGVLPSTAMLLGSPEAWDPSTDDQEQLLWPGQPSTMETKPQSSEQPQHCLLFLPFLTVTLVYRFLCACFQKYIHLFICWLDYFL